MPSFQENRVQLPAAYNVAEILEKVPHNVESSDHQMNEDLTQSDHLSFVPCIPLMHRVAGMLTWAGNDRVEVAGPV